MSYAPALCAEDGRRAVVKVYFRDERRRLEREFWALRFLRGRGVTTVPEPYFHDVEQGYAVYSFEAGERRRPVGVSRTRQQMFSFGHRPATWQRVAMGASLDGKLEAIIHEAIGETSRFEDFTEHVVDWSGLLYRCDNVRLDYKVAALDVYTPMDMRAPGASWGVYALECSIDELAVKLDMDPIELRLRNYAERDQSEDKPFSSKALRACYEEGAQRFDWVRRNPRPRSMRDGHSLIGWGMASGVWETMQEPASAKAVLTADGRLTVTAATSDIGTGTYTVMTQIAAETLGLRLEDVTFKLGDSSFPDAPVQGGSFTVSSVGSAVQATCEKLRRKLFRLAQRTPASGAGKRLWLKKRSTKRQSLWNHSLKEKPAQPWRA